jgi:hypothetical protein
MGTVENLSKGKHGFHIHEVTVPFTVYLDYGVIKCDSTFLQRHLATPLPT